MLPALVNKHKIQSRVYEDCPSASYNIIAHTAQPKQMHGRESGRAGLAPLLGKPLQVGANHPRVRIWPLCNLSLQHLDHAQVNPNQVK